jgi:general secretion pathway protein K
MRRERGVAATLKSEAGVAAITAVLIVAVAASAAVLMLAQQGATLDQAMLVASRAQADQYAQAGLEWARGVLLQDARTAGSVDSLDEPWAQPIAGLPVERALVAGAIADEQGKFNINNLLAAATQKSPKDIVAFRRLLELLGLDPELSNAVVDWIDFDDDLTSTSGAEDSFYLALPRPYRAANRDMVQVEELYRVRGFDASTVAKLKPYVTAHERGTRVNVNTAAAPVLAAVLGEKASPDVVARLVSRRRAQPFRGQGEIAAFLGPDLAGAATALDVKSAFFSIRVQVSQDDVALAHEAFVKRVSNGAPVTLWRRSIY